jgi:hypothetical protein
MTGFQIALSGKAVVCCPHDRVKRDTTDLAFDPRVHKPHLCACCENLFLRRDDIPHLCPQCGGLPVHKLHAPLPDPIGEV